MSELLKAIQGAGPEDLAQVEARIGELQAEVDGLCVLRKVLRARLGQTPEPKPKKEPKPKGEGGGGAGRPSNAEMLNRRRTAAAYLIRHGATPGPKLAQACGFDGLQVYTVCNHGWFTKNEQGYHVTPEGRQAVG